MLRFLFAWFVTVSCAALPSGIAVAAPADESPRASSDAPRSETGPVKDPVGVSPDRLRKLLIERRDTLRKLVDTQQAMYKSANGSLESVIIASNRLLDAELELASQAERIAILEEKVRNARTLEDFVDGKYRSGAGPLTEVLEARSDRIDAEIQLERERMRQMVSPETQPAEVRKR